jgi:hypothetical protein
VAESLDRPRLQGKRASASTPPTLNRDL